MGFKVRSGLLTAQQNQQNRWRDYELRLAEERRQRQEAETKVGAAEEARKEAEAKLRDADLRRRDRDRQLADLHSASIEQKQFRQAALRSAANANARQRLKSILNPPPPPEPMPEPEIDPDPIGSYFGEPGFSVELWSKRKRNRSWW